MPGSELPLAGVRVVDFGIGGVGPWAASQLAQMGATVVKIEAPNEFMVDVLPRWRTTTTTYRALNLGKRSVRLDLKEKSAATIAGKLLADADVMIENFRSGAMDRLGFGFDAVRARNEHIVYCSANGFGSEGELADLPCTDPHMQAFSGFAALNGHLPDGERLRFYGAIDLFTSGLVVEAVLAGLVRARRTGTAQRVEVSMLGAATSATLTQLAGAALDGATAGPRGRRGGHVHPDGIYRTADRPVALTVEDDDDFRRLCDVLGRAALADRPEYRHPEDRLRHAEILDKEIEDALAEAPAEWWLLALRRARIPSAPVHLDHELRAHVEAWRAGHLRLSTDADSVTGDAMVVAGPPWDFEGVAPAPPRPPSPGADTTLVVHAETDVWAALEASP
jgi:crotonobetainyl-CoA:carnitine CoA-transferase CaiB-like acyl-CoA transferase